MSMPELFSAPDTASASPDPKTPRSLPYILMGLALILSVASAVFSAYSLFKNSFSTASVAEKQTQHYSELAQKVAFLQNAFTETQRAEQTQTTKLSGLQKTISTLKSDPVFRTQRVLAQVRYLTQFSETQAALTHDKNTALAALQLAQQSVQDAHDHHLMPLTQALDEDIKQLQTVPSVDTAALFQQLTSLMQQVQALSAVPTRPTPVIATDHTEAVTTEVPWYRRIWVQSTRYVKKLFVIRHVDQANTPLLTLSQEAAIKQNITAELVMAQWALLHQQQGIFSNALQQAQQWILQYFPVANQEGVSNTFIQLLSTKVQVTLPSPTHTYAALTALSRTAEMTS